MQQGARRAGRLTGLVLAVALLPSVLAGCSDGGKGRGTSSAPSTEGIAPGVAPVYPPAEPPASTTSPSASPSVPPSPENSAAAPTTSPPASSEAPRTTPPAAPAKPAAPEFPVPVQIGSAQQLVTVKSRGSYATVATWQRQSDGTWTRLTVTENARIGANGVVPGSSRTQNTGTTPAGTYTMSEAFGINADPGTAMPYTRVGADHWWVEDNNSAYYNQMRLGSQGGFDQALPENDTNGSERLAKHDPAYRYAVVVNFNRSPAVRYRGAGIFLHVNGAGATAGCISVPQDFLVATLRWLDPAQNPRIAIG